MERRMDPKEDYVFKKLFGSEVNVGLLLSLLDAVLKPPSDRKLVSLEITNPFNDKDTPDDKMSIVDIKARDQLGRWYNIEMQMRRRLAYPERVLYYWAVLYGQQLREREKYTKLQPTISISFVNYILFPQVSDYHLDFQLRSSKHPDLVFTEQQALHLVELPKLRRSLAELTDPLDVWCYFLIHGAELDANSLPEPLRVPAVQKALEVVQIMSQNDQEWERYQARVKYERDQISLIEDAREEGLEQGLEQGDLVGRIHLCERLLKQALTPREKLLALSLEQLRARTEALEQQLGVAKQ